MSAAASLPLFDGVPAVALIDLLVEAEQLRQENRHLRQEAWLLCTGGSNPARSPFPLLKGDEIIQLLHSPRWRR